MIWYLWPISGVILYVVLVSIGKHLNEWKPSSQTQIINAIGSLIIGPMMVLVLLGTYITRTVAIKESTEE